MFDIDFSLPIVDFNNFNISQLSDALLFGGSVLLIGMVTIFTVLCLLWLFLIIFKLVFQNISDGTSKKKAVVQSSETELSTETATNNNDEEIVAVIAAAIAMAESEHSGMKFRVVSFRKV